MLSSFWRRPTTITLTPKPKPVIEGDPSKPIWIVIALLINGRELEITELLTRADAEQTYLDIRKARREGKDYEFDTLDGGRRMIDPKAIIDLYITAKINAEDR